MLADCGACVGVNDECVRHLDFGQQDLVELDGTPNVGVGPSSSREHICLALLLGRSGF